uniref:26S proteasome complex subunit SEM1 n=1 Tax=Gopherus agassizii TaxID=38772 RepID=A0A452GX67_9SAUR
MQPTWICLWPSHSQFPFVIDLYVQCYSCGCWKALVFLGWLENLDFVCFLSLDWAGLDEDEDAHVWEDNWDDDNVEDDFSNQLR